MKKKQDKLSFDATKKKGEDNVDLVEQDSSFDDYEDESDKKFASLKETLVAKGKEKGALSQDEVLDLTKELDLSDTQYDELFSFLMSQGVQVEKEDEFVEEDEAPDEAEMMDVERQMAEDELDEIDEADNEIDGLETIEDYTKIQAGDVKVNDSVRLYLREIGKRKLLSPQEETDLAKAIAAGKEAEEELVKAEAEGDQEKIAYYTYLVEEGKAAKNVLIESNLRLVVSISRHYQGKGMHVLDLVQEGNMGLIKAAEKFDYTKGFKFSTYATWWIRQAITRAIADQARTIRIPVHMVETINKMARVQRTLTQELDREPTAEEISAAMDGSLSPDRIREIQRIALDPVSLETPIGEEDDSRLGDFVEDKNSQGPVEYTTKSLLKEELFEIMKDLTDREEKVLRLRYGLDDNRPRTLEEVGKEFGVTRERIRQIEAKAIRKLRHPNRAKRLGDYRDIAPSIGPETHKKN